MFVDAVKVSAPIRFRNHSATPPNPICAHLPSPAHPSQATGVTFEVLADDYKVDFSRIERVV